MSDLISRAEAIRIAEQGQVQGFEWQFKKLCDLPSVQPRKWIPVSERLPEDEQVVLVQDTNGTIWIWKYLGENLEYRGSYQWMDDNGAWQLIDEVVAWMPLPGPWKGEEE